MTILRTIIEIIRGAIREGTRKRPPNVASLVVMRGLLVEQRRALARREAVLRHWIDRAEAAEASLVRMSLPAPSLDELMTETAGSLLVRSWATSCGPEERQERDSLKVLLERVATGAAKEIRKSERDVLAGQASFDARLADYCAALRTAELQGYDVAGLEYAVDEEAIGQAADADWEARRPEDPEGDRVEWLDRLHRERRQSQSN